MTTSRYPNHLDTFTTKENVVEGLENYTGDFVDADHVNVLQDAITKIEGVLGTNPQGSAEDVNERITELEDAKSLKTPSVCVFLGNPLTFNGATTTAQAVNEFLYFNHIVFGYNLEEPTTNGHEAFVQLVQEIKKSKNIKLYGYIDVAPIMTNDIALTNKIVLWKNIGINGIMLDNFGYDKDLTRTLQNHIIQLVHNEDMGCLIRATYDEDVFASTYDAVHNPDRTNPIIGQRDAYLHEVFCVNSINIDPYTDLTSLTSKCSRLTSYRYNSKAQLFATALIGNTVTEDEAQALFNYAQAFAIMYSYDAFYATTEAFGATSNSQRLYNNLSLAGNYTDNNPQIVQDGDYYYRIGSFGKIVIDTKNHVYNLEGVSIPGETIFGNINYVYLNNSQINGGQLDGVATELIIINSHSNLDFYAIDYMDALAPSNNISDTGLGLTQEMSDNGTLTYTISWGSYQQGELPANLILVFWKEGSNVGQPLANDKCVALLPTQMSYIFRNFISEKYYNFGVAVARRVGNVLKVGQIISPVEWQNVTQGTPDFNWSLDGRLQQELNNIVYKVEIISSNGITFKNGNINTNLQAKVYHGSDDVTDIIDSSKFQWTRSSNDIAGDSTWNFNHAGGYKSITITSDDVSVRASFTCTISD
jgi:hypothetical protein